MTWIAAMEETTPNPSDEAHKPKPRVLEHGAIPMSLRVRPMLCIVGAVCCLGFASAGALALWHGGNGLWYAATQAPSRDKAGDFFGAGLLSVIGILIGAFSIRWAVILLWRWRGTHAQNKTGMNE